MPIDRDCANVQRRIDEALFERREPGAVCNDHAATCPDCAGYLGAARSIAEQLEAEAVHPLDPARARGIRLRAARELAEDHAAAIARRRTSLPEGYAKEVVRILGWAIVPLPLALFAYAQLFRIGSEWLGRYLPELVMYAVGAATALGAASWLALIYGSIPFVAHLRLSARPPR